MSTGGTARKTDLIAVWFPHGRLDESPLTHIKASAGNEKPILARGIEADGEDLALVPVTAGQNDLLTKAGVGRDDAEMSGYWRRYPADAGQPAMFDRHPYLFSVRVFAPPEWQEPIRQWLDQEHFERQLVMDGVFYSEGYEPIEGPFHLFNLWAIRDPDLIDSPEWIRVRDSSWYEDVRPGFQASVVRREIYRVTTWTNLD
jgi:hypothetical protein